MGRLTQQPLTPTAIGAGVALPLAVVGSLLAHVAAMVLMPSVAPEPPPGVARKRGAMTVTVVAREAMAPPQPSVRHVHPSARIPLPSIRPEVSKGSEVSVRSHPSIPQGERAEAQGERVAAHGEQAAAPPSPAPTPPGAQFASLFAPVIQAPFGRSGWSRSTQRAPAPPPDRLAAQQAHAQAAWRLQGELRTRLQALAETLRQRQTVLACDISVDAERGIAQVDCDQAGDGALPWSYLQGLVVAGSVAESPWRQCFRLAEHGLADTGCSAPGISTP